MVVPNETEPADEIEPSAPPTEDTSLDESEPELDSCSESEKEEVTLKQILFLMFIANKTVFPC